MFCVDVVQKQCDMIFQLSKDVSTDTLIFGFCWGATCDVCFDFVVEKVVCFLVNVISQQSIILFLKKYEYFFENMRSFANICVTFQNPT